MSPESIGMMSTWIVMSGGIQNHDGGFTLRLGWFSWKPQDFRFPARLIDECAAAE